MRGSLDAPPIIVRSSRWKSLASLLFAAPLCAMATWVLVRIPKSEAASQALTLTVVGIGMIALIIPVVWHVLKYAVVQRSLWIGPDGVELRARKSVDRRSWDEVDHIRLDELYPWVVCVDCVPPGRSLGLVYLETGGRELGDLISAAQLRWSHRPPSQPPISSGGFPGWVLPLVGWVMAIGGAALSFGTVISSMRHETLVHTLHGTYMPSAALVAGQALGVGLVVAGLLFQLLPVGLPPFFTRVTSAGLWILDSRLRLIATILQSGISIPLSLLVSMQAAVAGASLAAMARSNAQPG
jgi:hypothetical protein